MNWLAIGATILPNIGGIMGAIAIKKSVKTWYESLKRPDWTPPNRAFAPVWTTLYTAMGFASYLVYRDGGGFEGPAHLALVVYGSNLIFNWAWSPIFFSAKQIKLAFYEILLVDATALASTHLFYQINPTAGYLLVPYCLWLSLATTLNYVIYRDNKPETVKNK